MSEQSYAVFQRNMERPSVDDLEKFCFDARTKGASGKTRLEYSSYQETFKVHIPESQASQPYAAKSSAPSGTKKRTVPTIAWLGLLIVCIVLGIFI